MNIRQKITLSILGLVIVVGGGVFSYFFITGQIKLGAQKITPSIKKVPYLIPAEAEFIPDRVIVKFKDRLALKSSYRSQKIKDEKTQKEINVSETMGISSVDFLNKKFNVKSASSMVSTKAFEKNIPPRFKNLFSFKIEKPVTQGLEIKKPIFVKTSKEKISTTKIIKKSPAIIRMEQIINEYQADPNVEYAEPSYVVKPELNPNDAYADSNGDGAWKRGSWQQPYDDLWALKKIKADMGWNTQIGKSSVTVAVIDTGVDYNHEDIASSIWSNQAEDADLKRANKIDDGDNGYLDDYRGWDFVGKDIFFGQQDNDPIDHFGHGTHVAGIIAAVGNNQKGIAGLAYGVKIMPLKVLDDNGLGTLDVVALALIYAADNGAKIVNLSLGGLTGFLGAGRSQIIADAVSYAYNKGVFIIAAAGNESADSYFFTPAQEPYVMAVAATDSEDKIASFSNGGEKIEVSAPGVDILSLRAAGTDMYRDGKNIVGERYYRASGTSMAAPFVAGLAALIASKTSVTNEEIRQFIINGVDDLGASGKDSEFGYGRINVEKTLSLIEKGTARIVNPELAGFLTFNPISKTVDIYGKTSDAYQLFVLKSDGTETLIGSGGRKISTGVLASLDTSKFTDGIIKLRLVVKNAQGNIVARDEGLTVIDNTLLFLTNLNVTPTIITPNGNSFNDSSTLSFNLSEDSLLSVVLTGNNTGVLPETTGDIPGLFSLGKHSFVWNGKNSFLKTAADGIYEFKIAVMDLGSHGEDGVIQTRASVRVKNTLLRDTFGGAIISSPRWQVISGNWSIRSGRLYQSQKTSSKRIFASEQEWADYTAATSCVIVSPKGACSLIFRVKDQKNFYAFEISDANKATLYKVVDGSWEKIKSKSISISTKKSYRLKVIAYGDSIKTYLGSSLMQNAADSAYLQGGIGLSTNKTNAFFDNIVVLNR